MAMDIVDKLIDDFNNSSAWLSFIILGGFTYWPTLVCAWWGAKPER